MKAERPRRPKNLGALGPGLITGAADDDPSGIATYSQAGAQFGFNMLWASVAAYPLLAAVQSVVARIGRATGKGLAANARAVLPAWVLYGVVLALLVANIVNIAADLTAMSAALKLLAPEPAPHLYTVSFVILCLGLEVFLPYKRYVPLLKWLTLALLAYVAVVFVVEVPWGEALTRLILPHLSFDKATVTMIVAVFGTTISPYLFFWQASEEVEEIHEDAERPLVQAPEDAPQQLQRIRIDTLVGLGFATAVAFFIKVTTAVTLHTQGVTEISTAAEAAAALRPVAGDFAFLLFAAGIVGTGLLALPVLAGSAAYAVAETFGWRSGLWRRATQASGFYGVMALATLGGLTLDFAHVDPIRALFGAAVVNGVTAPLMIAVSLIIGASRQIMGDFVITRGQKVLGWVAFVVMASGAAALIFV